MKIDPFPMILFETATAWRHQMDKRLKPLGLSQAKWRTLLHLSMAKAALSQTELAIRMGIEGATVVGLLDRLAKDGWIARKPDPSDRRGRKIYLTAKALNTLEIIRATADQLRQQILRFVPKQKIEDCVDLLQNIKKQLELVDGIK